MTEKILNVMLSGRYIGRAADWKEAERVARRALLARGQRIPRWDGESTWEDGRAFHFYLGRERS